MSFGLSGWMLYTMWAILIAIGVNILAGFYKALVSNTFSFTKIPNFLNGILVFVFPLFLLANITALDPTGLLITIAYFVGGIGVLVRYIIDIANKLR